MEDALKASVSGMRGVIGASLTPNVVVRYVAVVLHHFLTQRDGGADADAPRIVIARDGRVGSDIVRDLAVATARAAGADVIDIGVAPTPTAGVMTLHHAADGALVATASHNPQQWCGLKPITREGRAPAPADASAMVEAFERSDVEPPWAPPQRLGDWRSDETAAHVHVAQCLAALERVCSIEDVKRRRLRVAVDSVNASGAGVARLLLDALGCEASLLNDEPVGVFARPPEPLPEHLGQLCEAVKQGGCDVGFAVDPDGDRLVIVDERGQCMSEEKTLALATLTVLASLDDASGAVVATNLSTSRMIDDAAEQFGARVVRAPVGEANVARAMLEHDAVIGGEGNGGVIWPEVGLIRDSVSAMALTLALLTREGASMREMAQRIPDYAMRKRKIDVPSDLQAALEAIARGFKEARVDRSDGARVELPEQRAWLHVRASNTEPIVRLIAEAPDERTADELIAHAETALRDADARR